MRLIFAPQAWEDYQHWQHTNRKLLKRINSLIEATLRDPLSGIGKPAQLMYGISGAWSRRITDEHRLVYIIDRNDVVLLQIRYHYTKS